MRDGDQSKAHGHLVIGCRLQSGGQREPYKVSEQTGQD